jgi:Fe-S cluster assembly protein SufD
MVAELIKAENSYREAFSALQESGPASYPAWLTQLRESAMDRYEELGFPTVKDEEWKYTNVAPLVRSEFKPLVSGDSTAGGAEASDLASFGSVEAVGSQLVFVNGILRDDLSSLSALPEAVTAIDLGVALTDERFADIARKHLARQADHVANGLVALNTAFISHGAFIHIPKDVAVSAPISLLFISDGVQTAVFPRVLVVAEENSNATVLESYVSTADTQYFTNAVVELALGSGSRIEHYKIQRESTEAFHIATTMVDLGTNASYDSTTITFGAALSRHDIGVTMEHEGAECWVDGLYLVAAGQHTDTHSFIDHRKPHCTSHQLYKGILDGKSRAVFNGKIFVRHDAQKTDAMQTNKNLLLSNEARVDTKPQLEILADDVKCAHGAAVGQIDEDELFYLETRGIHHDLARNLLTYGFAEEVIGKIKIDSIRSQLDEAVLHRLNARLEA